MAKKARKKTAYEAARKPAATRKNIRKVAKKATRKPARKATTPAKLRKCYYLTTAAAKRIERAAKRQGKSLSEIVEDLTNNLK